MSILCGVVKGDLGAIASDSQHNCGSLKIMAKYQKTKGKFHKVNNSFIGHVGWCSIGNIIQHLIIKQPKLLKLNNKMEIFESFLKIHKTMKDDYFIETSEGDDDQPVESNQINALILNSNGLFNVDSYRNINEYHIFWAIGSGQSYALGAMNAVYNLDYTAQEIAEIGVTAATEFDDGCSLPLFSETLKMNNTTP